MVEPLTQWLPNVGYSVGEITYDDATTTYDSATTRYNGAAYAIPPIGASMDTQWTEVESNRPQTSIWTEVESNKPKPTRWT